MRALVLGMVLIACGASTPEPAPVSKPAPAPPVAVQAPSPPKDTLERAQVVRFVNAGFWNFLQQVEVEPALDDGRFRGWLIVALRPPAFWQGVDLSPGDVVTSVNDKPIERETQAFDTFQALKTAPSLKVAYVRAGSPRNISYRIAD